MTRCPDSWRTLFVKRKYLILLLVLAGATLVLSGCGVAREGVDVRSTAPEGWWQTLLVWPLAKMLINISDWLQLRQISYSWGFAIIIFTVIIRIVLLPLTYMQIKGMQGQKEIQPKLQALQKKYGKDRDRLMREQRKLYETEGISPLSGCLPILLLVVQMPILFGLYSALVALGGELDMAQFFWIPDLGFPEFTGGLNWISEMARAGDFGRLAAYLVLPLFLVATQFLMTKLTNPAATDSNSPQASTMRSVSTIMTVMFGFFSLQVPAGLSLYWVTGNLLQMAQQYLMTGLNPTSEPEAKRAPETRTASGTGTQPAQTEEAAAIIEGGTPAPGPKPRKRKKRKKRRR